MLILLVGLAFLIVSFSSFTLAFQINGINRVVVSTPIAIFETSILYDIDSENPEVLLTKKLVKQKLENYYNTELSKYTNDFEFEIYFYNIADESMCVKDECEAVEIQFYASLLFDYQYYRRLNYEVFDNSYGS